MNFDDIKKQMNTSVENLPDNELKINLKKGGNNPVQMIRKNMRKEITIQLVSVLILLIFPLVKFNLSPLAQSTYIIFMSLAAIMIFLYVIKLGSFLKKTANYNLNTKDTIKEFIFEIKLTLESYKAYVISSSLLVPFPFLALTLGSFGANENAVVDFEKWFTLNLNILELILLISSYIGISFFMYLITITWTNRLYGKYVIELENIIRDLGNGE